jgi:serpin B
MVAAGACSVALIAAGCAGGSSAGGPPQSGEGVLVGHVQRLALGSVTASQIAAADTSFGFALSSKLCAAHPTANLVLSPASAAQALGMLDAGAVGKTRSTVSRLLHLPGWGPAVVAALHEQSAALSQVSQVKVSNHVFEQTGLSPSESTLNDLATGYDADLRQLDFSHEPAATDSINAVISHDTDGLIPSLFDGSLDPGTQTVLANAILLDAKWQDPFPASQRGEFHAATGQDVQAPMMQNTNGSFASRASDGWQSVVLPYAGGKLQAVAILPPNLDGPSAASTCSGPSAATLSALTSGASAPAGVVMPKLNLSQTLPLTQTLASMGLPLVGDYTGLGAKDEQISTVVQKVVMKVDEQGTKAAAATGIGITTLARKADQRVVSFDRPFQLLLEDTATHTPLFLARVASP